MKQGTLHSPLAGGGIAVTLLVLAFDLYLAFGRLTNAGDGIVEPLDPSVEAGLSVTSRGGSR